MTNNKLDDSDYEGRDQHEVDIDRMVNEGLGGGLVTAHNGLIEDTTTDTLNKVASIIEDESCEDAR
ncbi:MAG: hypothetical protein WDZ91_15305 [Paenibacillaceae bacterium]